MRYDFLTFDCYGTLVDWRNGILSAFAEAVATDTAQPQPDRLLALHARHEAEVQAGSYRLYREVLAETARRMAVDLGLEGTFESFDFLADSLPRWRVFPEVDSALLALRRQGIQLGILSNIDDDLLTAALEQFEVEFDLLITAEQVRSYKPATTALRACPRAPRRAALAARGPEPVPRSRRRPAAGYPCGLDQSPRRAGGRRPTAGGDVARPERSGPLAGLSARLGVSVLPYNRCAS
jgi:2-haloalkanoic acid dehalogenase type II